MVCPCRALARLGDGANAASWMCRLCCNKVNSILQANTVKPRWSTVSPELLASAAHTVPTVLLTPPPSKAVDMAHLWRGGPNTTTWPAVLLTPPPSKAADMAHLCVPQNQALGVCRGFVPDIQVCGTHRREDLVKATITSNAEEEEEEEEVPTGSDDLDMKVRRAQYEQTSPTRGPGARVSTSKVGQFLWWLLACLTSQQHARTDLLRQFYVLPHRDRSCRSNFVSHPVTIY